MLAKIIVRSLVVLLVGVVVMAIANRRFLIGMWRYGGQARKGTLVEGDQAPDVRVWPLDGDPSRPLLEYVQGKPLVLVFGSFT